MRSGPPDNSSKKRIKRWFRMRSDVQAYEYMYSKGMYAPRHPVPSIYCLSLVSRKVDERAWNIAMFDMMLSYIRRR